MILWVVSDLDAEELVAWRTAAVMRLAGYSCASYHEPLDAALELARRQVDRAFEADRLKGNYQIISLKGALADVSAWIEIEGTDLVSARIVDLCAPGWLNDEARLLLRGALEEHARELGALRLIVRAGDGVASLPLSGYRLVSSHMIKSLTQASSEAPSVMISLEPMSDERFEQFRTVQIEAYADDLVRSGFSTLEAARATSSADLADLLPQGARTPGNDLFIGTVDGDEVAMLWLGPRPSGVSGTAWVCDIEVNEPFRRRGYGRALMIAAEDLLRSKGERWLGLNVFGFNDAARNLYLDLGYEVVQERFVTDL